MRVKSYFASTIMVKSSPLRPEVSYIHLGDCDESRSRATRAAILLCVYHHANAAILRCYECSSRSSWDHCNDHQVVTDCRSNEDHCAQFLAQAYNPVSGSSKESYFRSCASKRVCQRLQTSQVCDSFRNETSGARISCLVFCSSGNRSNGGKLPDRPFASSSSAKSTGEIVGGVVGPIILLVVAYVVVKKRRCCRYKNVFPDMLYLVHNLHKVEKELEEEEQEEGSTDKQLRFII